jgi:hypothetical protein
MEQPRIDLTPQQIQVAAQAGITLLNTPGAVNVPGPMAVSGAVRVLMQLLMAIANNEVAVINVPVQLKDAPPPSEPPNKEVAKAVAAAVESSGNSEKAPTGKVEKAPAGKVEETPAGEVSER